MRRVAAVAENATGPIHKNTNLTNLPAQPPGRVDRHI